MEVAEIQMLGDISSKVGRLEATQEASTKSVNEMATSVNRLVDKLELSDDVAKEALNSASSAHKRINAIDKVIFWVGTTFFSAFIIAVVTFIVRGGLITK